MVSYRLALAILAVLAASAVVEARVFHDGESLVLEHKQPSSTQARIGV